MKNLGTLFERLAYRQVDTEAIRRSEEALHRNECKRCRGDPTPLPCTRDPSYAAVRGRYIAGLPLEPSARKTLDSYHPRTKAQAQALRMAREYAQSPNGWLVLAGRAGTGKTHLALGVAEEVLARGGIVRFWHVADLIDFWRDEFSRHRSEGVELQASAQVRIAEKAVLILDDLGAERVTEFSLERLTLLLDWRHRERLQTVITTNLTYDGMLLRYSNERIASRVWGWKEDFVRGIIIDGPDSRRL